jgi:hypothetical protein
MKLRLTTRRLIVLIAVAALALVAIPGLIEWRDRRRAGFLNVVALHAAREKITSLYGRGRLGPTRRALYHREMAAKYSRAAERPWLPVFSDPPEPQAIP